MSLLLASAQVADAVAFRAGDLDIDNGTIRRISPTPLRASNDARVDLGGYCLLPGLINAHDHLEYGLSPRLGRGPYTNARA